MGALVRVLMAAVFLLAVACDLGEDVTTGATGTGPKGPTSTMTAPPARVEVPDVVGESASKARDDLRAAGLRPSVARQVYSDDPRGTVLRQAVDPGREVRPHRIVRLTLSKPIPRPVFGNPWGYNFICCRSIYKPPASFCTYFNCIPYFYSGVGYVIQCSDGAFSQSGGRSGSCSSHGGNGRTLLQMRVSGG
jgi:hypothetical protein